jgi:heptaprenyl diphosphate synthase
VLTLGNAAPLAYLPLLLGISLLSGSVTGFLAALLFRALRSTNLMKA